MPYLPSDRGQGLVEYALVLLLVAFVVVVVVSMLGPQVESLYIQVVEWMQAN
jgi:pilus assembly protein Flp/PilA